MTVGTQLAPPVHADELTDEQKNYVKGVLGVLRDYGQGTVADRLERDLPSGVVKFAELGVGEYGMTGKTGSHNETTLNTLQVDELAKHRRQMLAFRARGDEKAVAEEEKVMNYTILNAALSAVHEYVHQDQPNPHNRTSDETPAWGHRMEVEKDWIFGAMRQINRILATPNPTREDLGKLRLLKSDLEQLKMIHTESVQNDSTPEISTFEHERQMKELPDFQNTVRILVNSFQSNPRYQSIGSGSRDPKTTLNPFEPSQDKEPLHSGVKVTNPPDPFTPSEDNKPLRPGTTVINPAQRSMGIRSVQPAAGAHCHAAEPSAPVGRAASSGYQKVSPGLPHASNEAGSQAWSGGFVAFRESSAASSCPGQGH